MSVYNFLSNETNKIPAQYDLYNDDPSLTKTLAPPLDHHYNIDERMLDQLFLAEYNLDYIGHYFSGIGGTLRVITFPKPTNTCYEKAEVLPNWSHLNVIKALFFESSIDGMLYGIIVPETGCKLDTSQIKSEIGFSDNEILLKANHLPLNMSYGTCSPFIQQNDTFEYGGRLKYIIFDTETLQIKKEEDSLDDFSFGLNHRLSIQMNYYQCYEMLKYYFPNNVINKNILCLSLEERMIRKKDHIKVNYLFKSINYSTAKSITAAHGPCDNVSSIVESNFDTIIASCVS